MSGVRNLTQDEAAERRRLLDTRSYDIAIDLTDGSGGPGESTFRTVTTIGFDCAEPGASTFVEVGARRLRSAVLNGVPVDAAEWSAEAGLRITGLAADNTLVVDADFAYSTSGQGLHRLVDPADGEVYLYSHFEPHDAQKVYACFDQPDLKAVFSWHVTAPAHWQVVSNAPVAAVEPGLDGAQTVHFARSVRMSTYITAVCAGPYYVVRQEHDGIDLGLYARRSMARYLDAEDLFTITAQGFDLFHTQFGIRYPLAKYDQVFVPEFNVGAMENFGCVVNGEANFVFRSAATGFEYEQRSNILLHEMAHTWFGNLVTMRWWDDLWLKESFAEWAGHWASVSATRFRDAWTGFLAVRKTWSYRQDQMSSTHPVYAAIPDTAAVKVNFDGITYAKGASVIKQLVAYVGIEAFLQGVRRYFAKYAWSNATFGDLLAVLSEASGRDLAAFGEQWLSTAQVNTLRPVVAVGPDAAYERVSVEQSAPPSHPTLRQHRIGVGLYDFAGNRLVRRELRYADIAGPVTELTDLAGVRAADVLLLNDDDHTYAKLRFDPRSLASVVWAIGGLESSIARALCWTALWDMTRDAEYATRDYLALIAAALPAEPDINIVTMSLLQAQTAIAAYADPGWQPAGWGLLARTAQRAIAQATPGSGHQLVWARAYAAAARTDEELEVLADWLRGAGVPPGLPVGEELRWHVVQMLVAAGRADRAMIEKEHAADRTAAGDREAALALALLPTAEAKAAVWRELVAPQPLPNWRMRALLRGFHHPSHTELTQPYVGEFFLAAARLWSQRDGALAREFMISGFPVLQVSPRVVDLADAWLARNEDRPAALRRLMAEGRDTVLRSLAARACDARA